MEPINNATMAAADFLGIALNISLLMLTMSFFITIWRVIAGPTLPDRVLALDMLVSIAIGYIAIIGIKTGIHLYVDIAISLGLVGFLATVAFARFVLVRGKMLRQQQLKMPEQQANRRNTAQQPSGKTPS